jgi:biotin transport system substrate-specific component
VVTVIVGWFADRHGTSRVLPLLAVMLAANTLLFALGFAWLAWGMPLPGGGSGIGAEKAFAAGVAPFVLYDLVKIALAATGVAAASRLVRR